MSRTHLRRGASRLPRKEAVLNRYYSTLELVLQGIALGVGSVLFVALLLHLIGLVR